MDEFLEQAFRQVIKEVGFRSFIFAFIGKRPRRVTLARNNQMIHGAEQALRMADRGAPSPAYLKSPGSPLALASAPLTNRSCGKLLRIC